MKNMYIRQTLIDMRMVQFNVLLKLLLTDASGALQSNVFLKRTISLNKNACK